MLKISGFTLLLLLTLATGCATTPRFPAPTDYVPLDKVEIDLRYTTTRLNSSRLVNEVAKCMPNHPSSQQLAANAAAQIASGNIVVFGHASSASVYMLRGPVGFCLRSSSAGFPIFAAETFYRTVNPSGVPADIVEGWYRRIAQLIASKGSAKVAFLKKDGSAYLASYWVEKKPHYQLHYSMDSRKAGQFEPDEADLSFSHATTNGISVTERSGKKSKLYPLDHQRPKQDAPI